MATGDTAPVVAEGVSLHELARILRREFGVLSAMRELAARGASEEESAAFRGSLASLELHRAVTAREAAIELGCAGDPTLLALARRAPDPWGRVLKDQRRKLLFMAGALQESLPQVIDLRGEGPEAPRVLPRSLRDFLA